MAFPSDATSSLCAARAGSVGIPSVGGETVRSCSLRTVPAGDPTSASACASISAGVGLVAGVSTGLPIAGSGTTAAAIAVAPPGPAGRTSLVGTTRQS